jgi:hypothetical protein
MIINIRSFLGLTGYYQNYILRLFATNYSIVRVDKKGC